MSAPLDIAGILDRAGADADAPEGSQAWALAQVTAVVVRLTQASDNVATVMSNLIAAGRVDHRYSDYVTDLTDALARIGGQS